MALWARSVPNSRFFSTPWASPQDRIEESAKDEAVIPAQLQF